MIKTLVLIISVSLLLGCSNKNIKTNYFEIEIHNNWAFKSADDSIWIPATVPGNSINDLFNNNLINNINDLVQIEGIDVFFANNREYKTTFDLPLEILSQDSVFIQFDGLAGIADIYINQTFCFRAQNMFLAYRKQCKHLLKEYQNEILVRFIGSDNQQKSKNLDLFEYRKAPFLDGSEINPSTPFQGIWKPVKLIAWSEVIIKNVYFETLSVSEDNAQLEITVETESNITGKYSIGFEINGLMQNANFEINTKPGKQQHSYIISITKPELWWCNGMGKQILYNARTILYKENKPVFEKFNTFGIRKIEKIEQTDSIGYNFYFKLNNKPVFIKGGAWVPTGIFDAGTTPHKYEQLILKARDANINLLRVWGGGFYESDQFYELCDKLGIMVWQDLPLSTEALSHKQIQTMGIQEEILENIVRIRNHPSIICFYGNNNINPNAAYKHDKKLPGADTLVMQFFDSKLPELIHNICKVPYYSKTITTSKQPVVFDWRVWYDAAPLSAYYETSEGFLLEYGMQSLINENFLKIDNNTDEGLIPDAANKFQYCDLPWLGPGINGNSMIMDYLQMYYNTPLNYPMAVYLSQLFQADALKTAIEAHRLRKPFIMGSVFWHFNDSYPAITWSVIDYNNHTKPAYYAVKNAYKNIIIAPERLYGDVRLWLINDSTSQFDGECSITLHHFSGKVLFQKNIKTQVLAEQTQILWLINEKKLFKESDANKIFLNIQLTQNNKIVDEKFVYFTEPKYFDLPVPDISYTIESYNATNYKIKLTSNYFVKNVQVTFSGTDINFSDNCFDMLPGRIYEITTDFTGKKEELEKNLKIISLIDSY